MIFTTLTFIIFFALFFPLYWSTRSRTGQNFLIVIASYVFYSWWDVRFAGLMLAASLFDYAVGLGLERTQEPGCRRALLGFSLCCNLGLLGFFKYFNFFAENFRLVMATLGWQVDPVTLRVVLPVGISFYTFQTMSYTIDVYRRQIRAERSVIDYLAYVAFFPQLVAGPIERAGHLLPQFTNPRVFNYAQAVDGCRHILWGFFKKMAVADHLARVVEHVYAEPSAMTGPQLVIGTVCFAFQIYCDFSAYSDIAIGLAKLCGFDLMRNFAYPYFSQSVVEFWRRWHISLSTWFRDYVYVPLGGNRTTAARRASNVMATFLLSGLWHGASWNFLIWGGLNGLAMIPGALFGKKPAAHVSDTPGGERLLPRPRVILRMTATFAFICAGWVFFRSQTLPDALLILQKIVSDFLKVEAWRSAAEVLNHNYIGMRIVPLWGAMVIMEWAQRRHWHPLALDRLPRFLRWLIYTALIWGTLYWSAVNTAQFVYFQF